MKINKILMSFLVVTVFTISGCTKVKDEVIGTWNFQTFKDLPQTSVKWIFKEDGELIVISKLSGTEIRDTCKYSVSQSAFKKRIVIANGKTSIEQFDGSYRVEKFKKNILVLVREQLGDGSKGGSYLRCEMVRNE